MESVGSLMRGNDRVRVRGGVIICFKSLRQVFLHLPGQEENEALMASTFQRHGPRSEAKFGFLLRAAVLVTAACDPPICVLFLSLFFSKRI